MPVYEIQGRQKQNKRTAMYFNFAEIKYGILLTTNITARGVDFPSVQWVIQYDLPENFETYVHRIGRTARFMEKGKSVVFVDPSENNFFDIIKSKNIKLSIIRPNPEKQLSILNSLRVICAEHPEIKYLAQKAIISFLKSIYYMEDKNTFNVNNIDLKKLALSYGLI